ncbi:thymidylate synthase [Nitzschia inconspicua]|uniref:Bifunctional dihydrofolate reductase-thymidylate synthase n=1 Tax=Nitzschia inconspicua TaxID=303405 RepID=A0A9K3K3T5_9STRA|nr:thymidylate synthase [Nitzschia inconspicua]KAG7336655.1 thymidylate synthase [Nitzschia inconspicua]KAG7371641.1 thymidylate synthase [Nitzschia inconspicua]
MLIVKDMAATAIVAVSASTRGIGFQNELPWTTLKGDMKHFAKITKYGSSSTNGNKGGSTNGTTTTTTTATSSASSPTSAMSSPTKLNAVVMGRNTWNSIPQQFRPLTGRTNVVLTRTPSALHDIPDSVMVATSLRDAWQQLAQRDDLGEIFVIGGAQIYQQALEQNYVQKIIMTRVDTPPGMEFDTYFPDILSCPNNEWKLLQEDDPNQPPKEEQQQEEENGITYRFLTYIKPNKEETQYLDLIRKILKEGVIRGDRTGTGTQSIFGAQMRFELRHGQLPLLTTKKTFWRGVAEELLWFISGSTNANLLAEKNIHIWDGNGSKEFLESRGLGHREEGDLGPVYGFQWRHFGAEYKDMYTNYDGQGVDQLQQCIDKIKHNPEDRRIIMSAWNPAALDEMALPPCHLLCQFFVDTSKNELSCQLYQRSADMGLGVPFNIASYALLTHLMAHVTGRKPGELIHTLGDAHVYMNHIQPLQEQLEREPRPFPKLYINPSKTNIDDFVYDDLTVVGYNPHKAISMKMAV